MNVKAALQQAHALDLLDAQILLAHVLHTTRAALYSHDDRVLSEAEAAEWSWILDKRLSGFPAAYLVGEKECMGLMFEVNPDVLIPRPDTECVIETVLSLLKPGAQVLDVGTGSGVIAIAIASKRPDCVVLATDISERALAVAARNIQRHRLSNVTTQQSDLFSNITTRFDLIVSNPPYIAVSDPHLFGDIRFEPTTALVSGEDGLEVFRRLILQAPAYLNQNGWLCVEHGFDQAKQVRALFQSPGFHQIQTFQDLSGHDRVTVGSL